MSVVAQDVAARIADIDQLLKSIRDIKCDSIGLPELQHFGRRFSELHGALENVVRLDPTDAGPAKYIYRHVLGNALNEAAIVRRNVERPCGHHGDFETMEMMYRNGFEGTTERGKFVHKVLVAGRECESVRQRMQYLSVRLTALLSAGPRKSILSLASGPATELRLLPQELAGNIERVVLFDQDEAALEYSLLRLPPRVRERTVAVQGDVRELAGGNHEAFLGGRFDYIYSAGLCDYLDNASVSNLVKSSTALLAKSGRFEFGNFATWPAAFFVEMSCGWKLILRDQQDLARVIPAGIRADFTNVGDQVFAACAIAS